MELGLFCLSCHGNLTPRTSTSFEVHFDGLSCVFKKMICENGHYSISGIMFTNVDFNNLICGHPPLLKFIQCIQDLKSVLNNESGYHKFLDAFADHVHECDERDGVVAQMCEEETYTLTSGILVSHAAYSFVSFINALSNLSYEKFIIACEACTMEIRLSHVILVSSRL